MITSRKQITQETVKELLDYDKTTGILIWKERDNRWFSDIKYRKMWNARFAGQKALNNDDGHGYRFGSLLKFHVKAHRVIWLWVTGEWPFEDIDHINGIRSDNRFSNLRSVMTIENIQNCQLSKNNTSGFNGVSWCKITNRWFAYIWLKGKRKDLGRYENIEDAIAARKTANVKYGFHKNHGKKAP